MIIPRLEDPCPFCRSVRAYTRSDPPFKCPRCKRLEELEARARILDALEAAGVDNWEGYEQALEALG